MTSLAGKNILITGGSRGLGSVLARSLAERGAALMLTARSETDLRNVADSLSNLGTKVFIFPCDLAQPDQRLQLMSTVLEKFDRLDILVNNAGVEGEGAFLDLPWETNRQTLEINLMAAMHLAHMALPHMLKNKTGHIVNIASTAAGGGTPNVAAYCASKAGMLEWTRSLRLELENTGVHFTVILPGYVTGVGMFARWGVMPPASVGCCTPDQVACATVRAIEKNQLEVFVNSTPARLMFVLCELSPSLGDWFKHIVGAVDFQRRKMNRKA